MDVESSYAPSLFVSVVYDDPPDLVELETHIRAGDWSGKATAYASTTSLREQSIALSEWTYNPMGERRIEAGSDNGIGWLVLRFYSIDIAGHVVCQVMLAASSADAINPPHVPRLSVEVRTELGLVERFARQLARLAKNYRGQAALECLPG
jgi:hypothetical protein